ncbi:MULTISPECIES: hypothetical protein [Methylomonas]|uniref:hypothetical protein n=1 Tax=Methylomonas TaxID=416 RepID=UPI0012322F04|nr:hypothetical protein [Methylomonas rhizoryzae]
MRIRRLVCLLLIAAAGCADRAVQRSDAQSALSGTDYFVKSYRQDAVNAGRQTLEQYLLWVTRFYQGWDIYPSGWEQIQRNLLEPLPDDSNRTELEAKLEHLGRSIAAEWAKNNATRRIHTRHVAIWGRALQRAQALGQAPAMIERITTDVDNLLENKISADVITENRFYAEDDVLSEYP